MCAHDNDTPVVRSRETRRRATADVINIVLKSTIKRSVFIFSFTFYTLLFSDKALAKVADKIFAVYSLTYISIDSAVRRREDFERCTLVRRAGRVERFHGASRVFFSRPKRRRDRRRRSRDDGRARTITSKKARARDDDVAEEARR